MANTVGGLFFQGGWVMWPLLIFSVLTWAIVFERLVLFLTWRSKLLKLLEGTTQFVQQNDFAGAKQFCNTFSKPIASLISPSLDADPNDKEKALSHLDRNRQKMMAIFKKNLWMLGTVASASPFVGLLGTVIGIVRAFHSMAEKGVGGFNVVAAGISEALIATAFGLIVAIIALITYNIFTILSNQTITHIKLGIEELLQEVLDRKQKAKG